MAQRKQMRSDSRSRRPVGFPWRAIGSGIAADAQPVDAMFDEPLAADGDTVALEIEPQRYRLIIYGDRVPVPENPRID